jgi:Outer membrane protein beta-barrel domain
MKAKSLSFWRRIVRSRWVFVMMTVLGLANLSSSLIPFAPEMAGESDLSSVGFKKNRVSALAGSQKISSSKFNEVIPKPRAHARTRLKTAARVPVKNKRVSVSFDSSPSSSPAATPIPQDAFYAKMRDSKAGRSALPMNVDDSSTPSAVAPKASPATTQVVVNTYYRPRRASESWSAREDDDAPAYSSRSAEAPAVSRASTRVYPRSRASSGVTLIPFGGMSYTQNVVQGTFVDPSNGFTSSTDVSGKPGFSLGVLADLGDSQIALQTGLVYIQEGAQVKINGRDYYGDPYSVDAKLTSHFIGVPLLVKLNLGAPGSLRFNFKGGIVPVYATNVDLESTSQYVDGYGMTQSQKFAGSSDTDLRRFNVLGQLGGGLVIPMDETFDLRLDAVYSRSFLSLSGGSNRENMYTQSFTGTFGFGIHL